MTMAFDGVAMVPMDADRVVEDQTVLVDGGEVTWIGPRQEARVPAGAQRIDGRGRYLLPGLADMHTHPATEADLLSFLAFGVTTIRNLYGMPRHLSWQRRIARGELLGPTIHTVGPIIDGRPVRNIWSFSVTTRDEAEQAVLHTRRAGYQAIKVYDQLTPAAYQWLVDAAQAHGLPVVGHVPFMVGLDGVLKSGQRSIEHLYGYLDALQPVSADDQAAERPQDLAQMRAALLDNARAAREQVIPELAAATRAAGVWNCPTLLLRKRWTQPRGELPVLTELNSLSPAKTAFWERFPTTYPTDAATHRLWSINRQLTKALSDAGAGLLVGTDAGVPTLTPGTTVHEELGLFVEAGLTPFQALRAATSDAAAFLGEPGRWGTIVAGSRADLVLLAANPLTDIANTTQIVGVMSQGHWHDVQPLRTRLRELAAAQRAVPRQALASPPRPANDATRSHTLRYLVEWSGHPVAEEEVVVVQRGDGSVERLRSTAEVESFTGHLLFGLEAGSYQATTEVGPNGVDQAAWFEVDGVDGHHRVELTRELSHVRVQSTGPLENGSTPLVEASDDALLARPLGAMFVQLADRARSLAIGQHVDVAIVGPGLPPDFGVATGNVHLERLPDVADRPHFAFVFERPNASYAGEVRVDDDGFPAQIVFGGNPRTRVTRQPDRSL